MPEPEKPETDPNVINVEPGTLVLIISVLLLLPLLFAGFFFQ